MSRWLGNTTRPPARVEFDLSDPTLLNNPFPRYAEMRARGAILKGGAGLWLVPRYREVAELLKDRRLTKTLPEPYYRYLVDDAELSAFLSGQNLGRRNRLAGEILARSFNPRLVRELGGLLDTLADGLVDKALAAGEVDAVTDLAMPLPLLVICRLLGIPDSDRENVRPHAEALVRVFGDAASLSSSDVAEAVTSLRWLRQYLTLLLAAESPGDNLLTRMSRTRAGGQRLRPAEIVDNAITVFYAGFETSTSLICNGILRLTEHPEQLARLRADRGLLDTAVDEIVRFDAPIHVTMRSPLEPIEVAGQPVRPGRVLFLLVGAANRDDRQFANPDRFDIGRSPNPHLSFGAGVYHCIGAALARAEGAALLDRLLTRVSHIELAGAPQRKRRLNFRAFDRLPLRLRPT